MINFLMGGNDMEGIDDESDQDDGREDVDEAADIRGISSLVKQEPFQLFSRCHRLGNKKQAGSEMDILPVLSCSICFFAIPILACNIYRVNRNAVPSCDSFAPMV